LKKNKNHLIFGLKKPSKSCENSPLEWMSEEDEKTLEFVRIHTPLKSSLGMTSIFSMG
jgi:hypothetical protein